MQRECLLIPPTSFREAMDWLEAVRSTAGIKPLGEAVYALIRESTTRTLRLDLMHSVKTNVRNFLRFEGFTGFPSFRLMLDSVTGYPSPEHAICLNGDKHDPEAVKMGVKGYCDVTEFDTLQYEDVHRMVYETIQTAHYLVDGIKKVESYEDSYVSKPLWDVSCKEKPQKCAEVFIGIIPMIYPTLFELYKYTQRFDNWDLHIKTKKDDTLGWLFEGSGYTFYKDLKGKVNAEDIEITIPYVDMDYFKKLYHLAGFWKFYPQSHVYPQAYPIGDGKEHTVGENHDPYEKKYRARRMRR
ncbi:hypothetical protein BBBOND_0208830 [Babesia bigemina]|uniref:Uncharacterized protein n=1 Tax=Babesia bigemina TaxID=5866 RepID=A0A061D9Z1_BABBI|nr:hypothetical protein BBBOND_0208830 [Babesia bigemina]CDR95729.1 hypothetical protein BBBOND_0208830 [Babesia bigemina]|eukprot:XP_012767915.1 hypothetical protein BBBOND_0208830 [Babesia bigemina]